MRLTPVKATLLLLMVVLSWVLSYFAEMITRNQEEPFPIPYPLLFNSDLEGCAHPWRVTQKID